MEKDCFLITHLDRLSEFEDEWDRVQQSSLNRSPLAEFSYSSKWYELFSSPEEIRVFRIISSGETIGFMPLVLRRKWGVRELGNLSRRNDAVPQPPIKKGHEKQFGELFLNLLVETSEFWDVFRHENAFSFFYPEGFLDDQLLIETGFKWKKKRGPTYCVDLNRTFEEYYQKDLSKKVRKNIKAANNRLKKAGKYSYIHVTDDLAIEYWPEFLELEASGWKGNQGSAIKMSDESVLIFYNHLLHTLARTGDLHLYFLKLDNRPIAASFGYTEGHVYHWAKIAYDEEYSYLSPSNLLLVHLTSDIMIRYPWMKIFHMFPDDHGFKHRFINTKAESIDTLVYSPTMRGRLFDLSTRFKNRVIDKNPRVAEFSKNVLKRIWFR